MTTIQQTNGNSKQATIEQAGTVKATACCGGPAPTASAACCARDHEVKAGGSRGCGCGTAPPVSKCC
jgi:hypothetical protein